MRIKLITQICRTREQIASGEKRRERTQILEGVARVVEEGFWVTFFYEDGNSQSVARDYLSKYEKI